MIKIIDVLNIAVEEEGYLEKSNNHNLDSKTLNAGSKNYTKYGRDLHAWVGSPYANGVAWCDEFVDWCFFKAALRTNSNNLEKAIEEVRKTIGGFSAYTPTSADMYKKMDRWSHEPHIGDQIFFKNSERICHTGLVYKIDGEMIHTIEGNTSSAKGVVANGGCVRRKAYNRNYDRIAGYGSPLYRDEEIKKYCYNEKKQYSEIANEVLAGKWGNNPGRMMQLIAAGYDYDRVQKLVNKILNHEEISKKDDFPDIPEVPPELSKGSQGNGVKNLQLLLNKTLNTELEIDGDFGSKTRQALINFQNKYRLVSDGIYGRVTMETFNNIYNNLED